MYYSIYVENLRKIDKLSKLYDYADNKSQHINTKKTKYMHMSNSPLLEPIVLENGKCIHPVDTKEGYTFLGFKLSYSNDVYTLIQTNLNSKMFNLVKFYAWLEDNENTPFFIKIRVLYACLFASILYSVEAWGDVAKYNKLMK